MRETPIAQWTAGAQYPPLCRPPWLTVPPAHAPPTTASAPHRRHHPAYLHRRHLPFKCPFDGTCPYTCPGYALRCRSRSSATKTYNNRLASPFHSFFGVMEPHVHLQDAHTDFLAPSLSVEGGLWINVPIVVGDLTLLLWRGRRGVAPSASMPHIPHAMKHAFHEPFMLETPHLPCIALHAPRMDQT